MKILNDEQIIPALCNILILYLFSSIENSLIQMFTGEIEPELLIHIKSSVNSLEYIVIGFHLTTMQNLNLQN